MSSKPISPFIDGAGWNPTIGIGDLPSLVLLDERPQATFVRSISDQSHNRAPTTHSYESLNDTLQEWERNIFTPLEISNRSMEDLETLGKSKNPTVWHLYYQLSLIAKKKGEDELSAHFFEKMLLSIPKNKQEVWHICAIRVAATMGRHRGLKTVAQGVESCEINNQLVQSVLESTRVLRDEESLHTLGRLGALENVQEADLLAIQQAYRNLRHQLMPELEESVEVVVQQPVSNVDHSYGECFQLRLNGNWDALLKKLQVEIKVNPKREFLWRFRLELCLRDPNFGRDEELFNQAFTNFPDVGKWEILLRQAEYFLKLKNERCREYYIKAQEFAKGNKYEHLIMIMHAKALLRFEDKKEALDLCLKTIALTRAEHYDPRENHHFEVQRNSILEKCGAVAPISSLEYEDVRRWLFLIYHEIRNGGNSIKTAKHALQKFPNNIALLHLYFQLLMKVDQDKVFQEKLSLQLQTSPSAELYCLMAQYYMQPTTLNLKEAKKQLEVAMHFNPLYGDSYIESARYLFLNNTSDVRKLLELKIAANQVPKKYGLQWALHKVESYSTPSEIIDNAFLKIKELRAPITYGNIVEYFKNGHIKSEEYDRGFFEEPIDLF